MSEILGDLNGVRKSFIEGLESVYNIKTERGQFCNPEILELLAAFTGHTGREAMVYIDRSGHVCSLGVGEQDRVSVPALRTRRSTERLSGMRCIHTHPGGNSQLSGVDIQTLKTLRLDAMAAVGVQGDKPVSMHVSILDSISTDGDMTVRLYGPYNIGAVSDESIWAQIMLADERIRPVESVKTDHGMERVILVGITDDRGDYDSLEELGRLADTAGYIAISLQRQLRENPDRATYIGYGKLRDLSLQIQALSADAVIFDDELSPAQIKNIGNELGKKVGIIDRTSLILEIFSQRAGTHEGRLQVELAQTKYLLPRMAGYWTHMSRMGGGSGGARRGEGETQLEVDRRILRKRIHELEREIAKIKSRREVQRLARERSSIPVVAIVGYTNAGKSTLLNRLSDSDVLSEDKLFATLDTTSRRVLFDSGEFLLVDTVGFINKLPHDLVNAFRATLEEVCYADLLLHVADASSPARLRQMSVVTEVLGNLGAGEKPMLTVYNKCDNLNEKPEEEQDVSISALTGMGIEELKEALKTELSKRRISLSAVLPHDAGALISRLYARGQVISQEYREDGIYITATVPPEEAAGIRRAEIVIKENEDEIEDYSTF